ncbi:hypothetical protein LV457_10835 [Mycobacterium sp. MYCO198283]|uniref:hypothetical protein n=1 Tax=Mycobacterium sp. MYCO198283 TaxID=2883505 RepID=UPI001E4DB509|nr:hypothetical protein [Mycobacterium sp. MYCO198283]MCG5432782.1 hypothetical protein [Mycobacterium sp. MYCO198283]
MHSPSMPSMPSLLSSSVPTMLASGSSLGAGHVPTELPPPLQGFQDLTKGFTSGLNAPPPMMHNVMQALPLDQPPTMAQAGGASSVAPPAATAAAPAPAAPPPPLPASVLAAAGLSATGTGAALVSSETTHQRLDAAVA